MLYFGCHSILYKGSTVAHCKTDHSEIIGLVVQASPEIILLCCVMFDFGYFAILEC